MTAGSWVRSSPVAAGLAAARSRLPAGALELACHAAVPVAVDAGLLHLLRINFFLDPPAVLPFETEAALLLSPLFREVGEDLYEIDPTLRDALLASLVARFGPERPARVAVLLEQYTDQHPTWHTQPELEHAQRLTALNLVDPARATDWLAANRTSAGGPALTHEWFVAMTGRLRPRTSLQDRLDAALADTRSVDGLTRLSALAELGELALLPGADVRRIAVELEHAARTGDPAGRSLASTILGTLVQVVPPPPPRQAVQEAAGGYEAVPFPQLHGIDPPAFDPATAWTTRGNLTVPIGTDPDGRPVLLDLREPGHGGAGPHGLVVGAVGSGKSELLRTLILGLAATNSPADLTILPVDFRGGATFTGLDPLPHLAGLALDLGDDLSLLDRFKDVVQGEVMRRQEPFTERRPHLLVVVDEFDAMLTTDPSLIETFATIGRHGRALGIHLLLAGQRFQPGLLRGLEAHLSFRIALRTSSASESQDAIGTPDASALPHGPGHGYLRTLDDDAPLRFRAAYVSGPYPPTPPTWDDVLDPYRGPRADTLLDVLVAAMAGHGGPVHQVWLPPLPKQLALGDLPADGVVIGEVDIPREHRRRPFAIDLTRASGNVAVVGARGTGRTTALLTVVTALSRTSRPVGVYCVGGGLGSLAGLPPVVTVLEPDDTLVATTVAALLRDPSPFPDTVLVVDGWSAVRDRCPDLEELAQSGHAVIVAADERWDQFSDDDLATFGTIIELLLADPETSRVSAADARGLRRAGRGRAVVGEARRLQVALPIQQLGGSHDAYVRDLTATGVAGPPPRVDLGSDSADETIAPRSLTVRLGTDADGRPVDLDLRDPGLGGMGPHGIIVGATDSGRADLLRTLILGLAATHSPTDLNLLLVDLHDAGTLAGLGPLRHLAGLAFGSGDDPVLIERFKDVIDGEIARRRRQPTGQHPRLLIVIDRFSELLDAHPSIVNTLLKICRLGRAVGVHLLLTTHRLRPRQLLGLDPYLTFRIAVATSTRDESQEVIGAPDAYAGTGGPGEAYLRDKTTDALVRFRTTPVPDRGATRMDGEGGPVHQIWLQPLPRFVALDELPADRVATGVADFPREHRQAPLAMEVSSGSGHIAFVGGPRSGKTTALRTLVTALSRTSRRVRVYCIGAELGPLRDLPIVMEVLDPDRAYDMAVRLISFLLSDTTGDAVLVVDEWSRTLQRFPQLDVLVAGQQAVVVAAEERWTGFRENHLGRFASIVELRLADPETSRISVSSARLVPPATPGRGLLGGGGHVQIASPPTDRRSKRIRLGSFEPDGGEFAVDFVADWHLVVIGASPFERRVLRWTIEQAVPGSVIGLGEVPEDAEGWLRSVRLGSTGPELWVFADSDDAGRLRVLVDVLPQAQHMRLHIIAFPSPTLASDGLARSLQQRGAPTIRFDPDIRGRGVLSVPNEPDRRFRLGVQRS
ncbi:FtsK/SpoIIIE domain-containing protein [Dactylosporangium sp. NPDC049742]|uniref:FtsK/SpoIIIE domain-containing protein n=1 Tax=Dactylosporangium sp. NPDC049742 TaxID=3154737 RepID=UPI0034426CE1